MAKFSVKKIEKNVNKVVCNGDDTHPITYYSLDGAEEIVCRYCSCLFTKKNVKGAEKYVG